MNNVLVRFTAALVLAFTWIVVWQQILYAGELPGEGFTASILTLLAVLLQFVVLGRREAAARLSPAAFRGALLMGCALWIALMAGPLAWGRPIFSTFKLPLGFTTVSSTTLFDVALFLMITGAMLTAFMGLEETTMGSLEGGK